jgi:flagellum-specific peptidoglycan hydrolase FlgJ
MRVSGFTGDATGTCISHLQVHIDPNGTSNVTLTWANGNLSAETLPTSFAASPGAGLCTVDCSNDEASRKDGSRCTPIGDFTVQEGYPCHLAGYPNATFVTWFHRERAIAFHYLDIPRYPASHGCVRVEREGYAAEWIFDNTIPGVTTVTVERDSSQGPGPKCWAGPGHHDTLINRPKPKKAGTKRKRRALQRSADQALAATESLIHEPVRSGQEAGESLDTIAGPEVSIPARSVATLHRKGEGKKQGGAKKSPSCYPNVVQFMLAHWADAASVANGLGVPPENVLGVAAEESGWGSSSIAQQANNYFGVHGSGTKGSFTTTKGVKVAAFASFAESAQSFAQRFGNLVQGKQSPDAFAQALVPKFNTADDKTGGNPKFLSVVGGAIRLIRRHCSCPEVKGICDTKASQVEVDDGSTMLASDELTTDGTAGGTADDIGLASDVGESDLASDQTSADDTAMT